MRSHSACLVPLDTPSPQVSRISRTAPQFASMHVLPLLWDQLRPSMIVKP